MLSIIVIKIKGIAYLNMSYLCQIPLNNKSLSFDIGNNALTLGD